METVKKCVLIDQIEWLASLLLLAPTTLKDRCDLMNSNDLI